VRCCYRADEDAIYAQNLFKKEQLKKNEVKINEEDVRLAKRMQREEVEELHR